MTELVKYIVDQLVDDKSAVNVSSDNGEDVETITIRVAENDIGKVIGKQGKIAMAIRTLAKAVGAKVGKRFNIEIADDQFIAIDAFVAIAQNATFCGFFVIAVFATKFGEQPFSNQACNGIKNQIVFGKRFKNERDKFTFGAVFCKGCKACLFGNIQMPNVLYCGRKL